MKRIKFSPLFIIAVLALSSCSRAIVFNDKVKDEYNLSPNEIKGLQFYTSHDIMLERREDEKKEKGTSSSGTLVISEKSSSETVLIERGTKGVCVKVFDDNKIAIAFEADDNKYLVFGDPNRIGRYSLFAAEWKNGKGILEYGGQNYYAMPGSGNCYLKIKMKRIKKYKKSVKKVGGRTV